MESFVHLQIMIDGNEVLLTAVNLPAKMSLTHSFIDNMGRVIHNMRFCVARADVPGLEVNPLPIQANKCWRLML